MAKNRVFIGEETYCIVLVASLLNRFEKFLLNDEGQETISLLG